MGIAPLSPTPRFPTRARRGLRWLAVVVLVSAVIIATLIARSTDFGSSSTLQGSGVAVRQARTVAAFTAVDLAGSNNVTIQVGRGRSVVVRADDNLVRHVTTHVKAGTLVIDNTGSFSTKTPMTVAISVPRLTALRLSGSGTVVAHGIAAARFTVDLSGSGTVRAGGRATRLAATLGGSGQEELVALVARDVRAVVAGSGEIRATASDRLDATVSGSGAIDYAGNPGHVRTRVTGSGTIKHV